MVSPYKWPCPKINGFHWGETSPRNRCRILGPYFYNWCLWSHLVRHLFFTTPRLHGVIKPREKPPLPDPSYSVIADRLATWLSSLPSFFGGQKPHKGKSAKSERGELDRVKCFGGQDDLEPKTCECCPFLVSPFTPCGISTENCLLENLHIKQVSMVHLPCIDGLNTYVSTSCMVATKLLTAIHSGF